MLILLFVISSSLDEVFTESLGGSAACCSQTLGKGAHVYFVQKLQVRKMSRG